MIAAVRTANGLCIVRWTGREGIKVNSHTYCAVRGSAADGVEQVPDAAISCEACKAEVKKQYGHSYDS